MRASTWVGVGVASALAVIGACGDAEPSAVSGAGGGGGADGGAGRGGAAPSAGAFAGGGGSISGTSGASSGVWSAMRSVLSGRRHRARSRRWCLARSG